MRVLVSDVTHAVRSLVKQPRFTLVAALTLALGVGAVTAIFSVVNGVLLKPLPYPDADRLVNVWSHAPKLGYDQFPLSPDIYFRFRQDTRTFESMTMFQTRRANVSGDAAPEVVSTMATTHTYFSTMGVPVARGRSYDEKEDTPGSERVTVISHRMWRDRFNEDDSTIGRVITLNGQPTQIIGVASAAIDTNGSPDLFVPAQLNPENPPQGSFGWNVRARLAPGLTPEDAQGQLAGQIEHLLAGAIGPTYRAFLTDGGYENRVHLVKEDVVGTLQRPLWILLGTVGLLLLIACANVANLLLVRAEARQLEVAVRVAMGASRLALVRAFLIEALVLSSFGSALGVVVAAIGLPFLLRQAPPNIPRLDQVTLDPIVLAFAVGTAVLSALLFGLLPALRYTRPRSLAALRHGGRGGTEEPARRRARQGLVIAQTAMAVILLVGSGLLARSFAKLLSTDLGFETTNVMTFRVALPATQYADDAAKETFADRVLTSLRALPGVEQAGAVTVLPIAYSTPGTAHTFEGREGAPGEMPPLVHYKAVEPDYFETMGIPIRSGRDFHSGDYAANSTTLLVNQALADQYWPSQDPIGKRIRLTGGDSAVPPWFTVVGVVGTERQDGLRLPVRALVYYAGRLPLDGGVPNVFDYVVRGRGITERGEELRQAVWAIDRSLPVASLRSMQSIVDDSLVQFTFTMFTLGIAAVMALALGSIGLYGVLSYAVTLRTREIGVRLALGATPSVVMRSVVKNGAILAAIGLIVGLGAAAGLTTVMQGLLFETEPLDPMTFVGMSLVLLAVALCAAYLPARRAAKVSPLESMKSQ